MKNFKISIENIKSIHIPTIIIFIIIAINIMIILLLYYNKILKLLL
jgi:hypothetical protein